MSVPLRGLVALLLIGVSAGLSAASDALRTTPRAPGGVGSLLGGLSVVASQALWIRAENALAERRDADALAYLDLLVELTPQLVAASDHMADEIGANRAREFSDPDAKWSFVREGLRIHDRSVAHNPGSAEAYLARGRYLSLRIAASEPLWQRFEKERGRAVLAAAADDLARAHELDPGSREVLEPLGNALRLLGFKLFYGDGDAPAAAVELRRAADAYDELLPLLAELDGQLAGNPPAQRMLARKRLLPALCRGLAEVAEAPAAERAALYRAFRERFEDAFPDLPPLK